MKKSTIFLVAGALVLAVVAFLITRKDEKAAPKKLDIAGYATPDQLEAKKKRGMMDPGEPIPHPIDEVILERADGRIRMVREGEGDKQQWKLTEPTDAVAVKYAVEQIIEVFESPSTRSDARAIKPTDFALFDFEAGRRIGLTLKSKGAVWNGVDLIVGQVVKDDSPESEGAVKGTWVMVKGDETMAFLLADKDLRTAADKPLTELRDKKAIDVEPDAMSRIELTPPGGAKIVLTSETREEPPAPDAGPDAKPTKTTTWSLVEPAGVKGDAGISSVARNLANLRVNEYVPLDKATDEAKKALAGPVWTLAWKVGEVTRVLKIADSNMDPVWGQIEGRSELLAIPNYGAKNLKKGLEELKDKTLWEVDQAAIVELTLSGAEGPVTLGREGTGWKFLAPALSYAADPSAILGTAAKLSAVRWAKADEVATARAMLAKPAFSAAVRTAGAMYSLTVSTPLEAADGGNPNRWAVVGDPATGEPFLLSDSTAKRFEAKVESLRQKKLFPDLKDALAAVTIQLALSPEVTTLERPSTGGELAVVGLPEGKTADDEVVRTVVSTLGALEAKAFHDGKPTTETGLEADKCTRVGLKLADGRAMELLISGLKAGEGAVYAMANAGPLANVPVALNDYQAKNLQKALSDFVKSDAPAAPPQ